MCCSKTSKLNIYVTAKSKRDFLQNSKVSRTCKFQKFGKFQNGNNQGIAAHPTSQNTIDRGAPSLA